MLTTASTSQIDKVIYVMSAFVTKTISNLDNVFFFKKSLRSILQLSNLQYSLLSARTAHRNSFLCRIHPTGATHGTCCSASHLLSLVSFFFSDCYLKLLFSNSNATTAEGIIYGEVFDDGPIKSDEIESSGRISMLQVWWETEGENHVDGYLCSNKFENRRSFWNGEKKDVSFLVS